MRVLVAHNRYQQAGGEDSVVAAEVAMLQAHGECVEIVRFDNDTISGLRAQALTSLTSFYSPAAHRRVSAAIRSFRPDVLHVHNFMPTMSPSVFFAASSAGVPVVQTLHNYRLICANGVLYRDGHTCESCPTERSFLPGVRHACFRGSRVGSAVVGGTMAVHAALGTWDRRVARYIALTDFAAGKLGEYRVPREKIRVKPNFVRDHGAGEGDGGYALFVGRLSDQKGVETLLAADALGRLPLPVLIAGDGPMRERVERACGAPGSQLRSLGHQTGAEVMAWMRRASALLVPSMTYEGFPMVIAEALSLGLPVVGSRLGSLPEIVDDRNFGFLHTPGDPESFLTALTCFLQVTPERVSEMRRAARTRYLERYGEETNLRTLRAIYGEAIATV